MKYRKKPIIVEAVQLTWENWNEICSFVPPGCFLGGVWLTEEGQATNNTTNLVGLKIKTIEGNEVLVKQGDYVVIDSKGFPYPCNKEIFETNHERL